MVANGRTQLLVFAILDRIPEALIFITNKGNELCNRCDLSQLAFEFHVQNRADSLCQNLINTVWIDLTCQRS